MYSCEIRNPLYIITDKFEQAFIIQFIQLQYFKFSVIKQLQNTSQKSSNGLKNSEQDYVQEFEKKLETFNSEIAELESR